MKTVYLYDENGEFSGVYQAQESPLEEGVYITPVMSTDIEPPSFTETQSCKFVDGAWVVSDKPIVVPELTPEEQAQQAQFAKQQLLYEIKVTTSQGRTFDGNEAARVNMLSAITVSSYLNQTSANWKLADNSVALITLDELKEALALSIQRVGEIVTS